MLGLFFFGGEVLAGFSFTMVVGILVGTYSTLYIAIPIVAWWSGVHRTSAEGRARPAPEDCTLRVGCPSPVTARAATEVGASASAG